MSLTDFLKSIADAIRNKTNTTEEIPASEFAARIEAIEAGIDTSDATAAAEHIQKGKTAYAANMLITGTLEPAPGDIKTGVTIAGVEGTFTADGNITAGEVLSGKIGYAKGNQVSGTMANNGAVNKSFTPSTSSQTYTIPQGYHDGNGTITVAAAPTSLINGTATATDVLSGKTFFSDSYTAKTGTMTNNGAITKTITPSASAQEYVIPSGYHNGTGKVTITGDTNLKAANIKSGVSIFGIAGTYERGTLSTLKIVNNSSVRIQPLTDIGMEALQAGESETYSVYLKCNFHIIGPNSFTVKEESLVDCILEEQKSVSIDGGRVRVLTLIPQSKDASVVIIST